MITAIHHRNEPCHGVAFWYDTNGLPGSDDVIDAGKVSMPDGTKPEIGSVMKCGTCGAELSIDALLLIPGQWDEVKVA